MAYQDAQSLLSLNTNNSRIASSLLAIYQKFTNSTDADGIGNGLTSSNSSNTKAFVRITAQDVESLIPSLENLGFSVTGTAPKHHFLEGLIDIGAIPQLESLESQGLMGVLSVPEPITSKGKATSQADVIHEANRVRASLPTGFDGTGVRIGVMSDSYNISGIGSAEADIASGDLPAQGVTVLQEGDPSWRPGQNFIDEGRAMLQLIHDVAPGSSLVFSSVVLSETDFAQQIRDLADPSKGNANILVDDIVYYVEPFFQDGYIAQAIDEVVTNYGVAYFSSAGNSARQAYESTNFAGAVDSAGIFEGTFHDFDPGSGVDTRQLITINPNQQISFSLQWDDPFYTTHGVDTNLDIFLVEPGTGKVLQSGFRLPTGENIILQEAKSDDNNIASQTPLELFTFNNLNTTPLQAEVMIRLTDGSEPGRIKYVNYGDNLTFNEFATNSSTITPHAAAANARAVGAVNYYDQLNPANFTSAGPATILFDPYGNRLTEPEIRFKPDFAAIQDTDTTFFGRDVDGNGLPNFPGTSASAPHAAAVAALVKQANPDFTPAQIYERLESTAMDIGVSGRDNLTGYGLINAYDAVFGSVVPASIGFTDNFDDGNLLLAYETNSTGAGRIQVTGNGDPLGTNHVTLDSSFSFVNSQKLELGAKSLNELILHIDTVNSSDVVLSFDQKEFNDSDDLMPEYFTGSVEADGVALSVDGTNWFRLFDLTGENSTNFYQNKSINLSDFADEKHLTLGEDVRIKFQQFGRFGITNETLLDGIPTNGFAFDNISVTSTPLV